MMAILRNRARLSQAMEGDLQVNGSLRKHIPITTVKEIIKASGKGWGSSRISSEYNVDPSVAEKLKNQFAVPVDNADGVVSLAFTSRPDNRVYGHKINSSQQICF